MRGDALLITKHSYIFSPDKFFNSLDPSFGQNLVIIPINCILFCLNFEFNFGHTRFIRFVIKNKYIMLY